MVDYSHFELLTVEIEDHVAFATIAAPPMNVMTRHLFAELAKFGILPGGTGTQRLPRLVGRGRAMEMILGGVDIDANTAADWGLLNRALPPDELRPFVTALAKRIASYPPIAVAHAKASVANSDELSLRDGMLEEAHLFQKTLRDPEAQRGMRRFLEIGGRTREGELRLTELIDDL